MDGGCIRTDSLWWINADLLVASCRRYLPCPAHRPRARLPAFFLDAVLLPANLAGCIRTHVVPQVVGSVRHSTVQRHGVLDYRYASHAHEVGGCSWFR